VAARGRSDRHGVPVGPLLRVRVRVRNTGDWPGGPRCQPDGGDGRGARQPPHPAGGRRRRVRVPARSARLGRRGRGRCARGAPGRSSSAPKARATRCSPRRSCSTTTRRSRTRARATSATRPRSTRSCCCAFRALTDDVEVRGAGDRTRGARAIVDARDALAAEALRCGLHGGPEGTERWPTGRRSWIDSAVIGWRGGRGSRVCDLVPRAARRDAMDLFLAGTRRTV
jgi:hypothetical protein